MILRAVRRAGRRVIRAAARRLSPARGQALRSTTRGVVTLITGRPGNRAGTPAKPRSSAADGSRGGGPGTAAGSGAAAAQLPKFARDELARAERAMLEGRLTEVAQRTERLARELPRNLRVLQLRAEALAGAGDARALAIALHRLHGVRDDPALRRQERLAVGHLVATSPGWLPRIPGPPEPLQASGDDVVLWLVPESAPYRTSTEIERVGANLAAAREAGLRPEVVTGLGFPRTIGVTGFPAVESIAGIPCHRLDLGPSYPLDRAADRLLRDAAWRLAEIVRRIRPALLHAIPDPDDPGLALIGLAAGQHFGLPLVLEVAAERDPAGHVGGHLTSTADDGRREAAWARAAQLADMLMTARETTRDRISAWGLGTDRIAIVADATAEPGYGARIGAIDAQAIAARDSMATA